jgi:hypothetical protein
MEGGGEKRRTYLVDHLPFREQHEDVEELEDGVAGLVDGQDDGLPIRGQVGKDLHHLFMGKGGRKERRVRTLLSPLKNGRSKETEEAVKQTQDLPCAQ